MSTVIVTTSPGFATVGKVPSFIEEKGWKLHRCVDTSRPHGGLLDFAADAEFLVVGLIPATAELMDKLPKLKAILKHGVGVDNIDKFCPTNNCLTFSLDGFIPLYRDDDHLGKAGSAFQAEYILKPLLEDTPQKISSSDE